MLASKKLKTAKFYFDTEKRFINCLIAVLTSSNYRERSELISLKLKRVNNRLQLPRANRPEILAKSNATIICLPEARTHKHITKNAGYQTAVYHNDDK